jgi:tetratricopeptide (TPR) repeat protein
MNAAFYPAEAGLGFASLADKDFADAIARFERVLKRAPNYVAALVGRGDAMVAAGRMDEGARSFQAALAEAPSLSDVRRRLDVIALRSQQETLTRARQAMDAGRFGEAAQAYERAIATSPESPFLYRELAAVERKQGKLAEALEHLRKAASLDASDARTWAQMGDVLEEKGDHVAAMDAYGKAQALEPGEETTAKLAKARAGAELARLPEAYRAIPTAALLTRGDLAALIGVRLGSLLASAPSQEAVVLTDVRSHWAASWIMQVVKAGVMEGFPNHTFQPRGVVHRLDMAQAVSRVLELVAARRPALGRAWAAARPRIADLSPTHLGYPSAATAVASGVMPLAEGLFRPTRVVSGAEAIEAVGRLEGLLR